MKSPNQNMRRALSLLNKLEKRMAKSESDIGHLIDDSTK